MNRIKIAAAWVRTHVPPLYVILAGLFVAWFSTAIRAHRTETQLDALRAKYDGAAAVQVVQVHDAQGHKLGAALVPQRAGDFFVSPTAASPFAIKDGSGVTRDTFETTHGRITAGGGGSDLVTAIGPVSGNETTDSELFLAPNGGAENNANFAVEYGALCDAISTHAHSVCFNGRGSSGTYGDVTFTNANGNAGSLERLGYFDANSGDFIPLFNVTFSPGKNGHVWTQTSGATLVLGGAQEVPTITLSASGAAVGTGNTSITGSMQYTTRTVTASFTVDTTTTDHTICADTSAGAFTMTLPAPTLGRSLTLVNCGSSGPTSGWAAHNLTVAQHASEKINGTAASKVLTGAGQPVCEFDSTDGVNWFTDCQFLIPLLFARRKRRAMNDNAERARKWLARAA